SAPALHPLSLHDALPISLISIAQAQECRVLDPELQGRYAGPCVNGLAEGQGSARGAAQYEGGFKAGRKHGKGVKTWPNGDRFERSEEHTSELQSPCNLVC